jgi:hypothetical protein
VIPKTIAGWSGVCRVPTHMPKSCLSHSADAKRVGARNRGEIRLSS